MAEVKAPAGLGAAGRRLWRQVCDRYEVESPHEATVLGQACRIVDRLDQLRDALAGADLAQPVSVRLLAEERQQRATLATLLMSKLGLPSGVVDEDGAPVRRTPRSRRAAKAAAVRWADPGPGVSGKAARAAQARWGRRAG